MKTKIICKVWGHEQIMHNDQSYCAKLLVLNRGCCCSIHFHALKNESFLMESGLMLLEIWGKLPKNYGEKHIANVRISEPKRYILSSLHGEGYSYPHFFIIEQRVPHRFTGLSGTCRFYEASSQDFADDSIRVTKSRGIDLLQ